MAHPRTCRWVAPVALLALAIPALAQGDTCGTATLIPSTPYDITVDNSALADGVTTGPPSCYPGPRARDAWFTYAVPEDGKLRVAAALVGQDIGGIAVNVYKGACGALVNLDCGANIDTDVNAPTLGINVAAGDIVFFQIGEVVLGRGGGGERGGGGALVHFSLDLLTDCPAGTFDKLTASDGSPVDTFGFYAAVDGDLAVVGAPNDDDLAESAGAAYVFERDGITGQWIEIRKLHASDGALNNRFGSTVAVSGDYIAVGAPARAGANSAEGAVYMFKRSAGDPTLFNQIRIVVAPAPFQNGKLSQALDLEGTTLMASAPGDNGDRGAVFVFRRDLGGSDNFGFFQKITPSDVALGDQFGYDADLSGGLIIGGSRRDANGQTESGSAYLFRLGATYTQVRKLIDPTPGVSAHFGASCAVDDGAGLAIVGAPDDRRIALNAGRAVIFEMNLGGHDNWGPRAELAASDPMANDTFAFDVAILGSVAFAGAPRADRAAPAPPTLDTGAVYAFARNHGGPDAWDQLAKIHALDADAGDRFGQSTVVDLAGRLIIGAPMDDELFGDAGAAYVGYGLADCNENGTLDVCDIFSGASDDDDMDSVPDECQRIGACCFGCAVVDPDRNLEPFLCADLNPAACEVAGGFYAGDGTSCDGGDCDSDVCRGDLDDDNDTDVFDFSIFASNFGCGAGRNDDCIADLNCDGVVNVYDFAIFCHDFGCGLTGID